MSQRSIVRDLEAASERQASLQINGITTEKVRDFLLPEISWEKSIVWITIVQIVIYVATVLYGSDNLSPNDHTLKVFGSTYGPDIRHGQIWRIVTPIFLHGGIFHLICNCIIILHLGLTLENKYGMRDFLWLYFLAGIWGNLLTVTMNPCVLAVGSSTSGFGLCGFLVCEVSLAWKNLNQDTRRVYSANITIFMLIFLFICTVPSVDMWGHIGGFLFGSTMAIYLNWDTPNIGWWSKPAFWVLAPINALVLVGFIAVTWFLSMYCSEALL